MTKDLTPIPSITGERLLTQSEFKRLADVPPEIEWFANLKNPNTRRAYRNVVMHYAKKLGIFMELLGPHALRATAATNALDHGADIAKVQEWLGHSNISTTRLYGRRNCPGCCWRFRHHRTLFCKQTPRHARTRPLPFHVEA